MPAILCIDVEPERVHDGKEPREPVGFEQIVGMIPTVRDALTEMTGRPANFVWCLRMDPNIAEVYGEPEWFATAYRHVFEELVERGDQLGVHPHNWRWDGEWVADHDDGDWIEYCAGVGLHAYRRAFGEDCTVYRHGDGYMSNRLLARVAQAGVRVDLTLEPGRAALRGLSDDEASRGWLPDTTGVSSSAYRPSRENFRVPDPSRSDAPLMLPLTPGPITRIGATGSKRVQTGAYPTLLLWSEPEQFRLGLQHRLEGGDVSHLAFAVHTQAGGDPDIWGAVLQNLGAASNALPNRLRWCTATEAAALAEPNARPR